MKRLTPVIVLVLFIVTVVFTIISTTAAAGFMAPAPGAEGNQKTRVTCFYTYACFLEPEDDGSNFCGLMYICSVIDDGTRYWIPEAHPGFDWFTALLEQWLKEQLDERTGTWSWHSDVRYGEIWSDQDVAEVRACMEEDEYVSLEDCCRSTSHDGINRFCAEVLGN